VTCIVSYQSPLEIDDKLNRLKFDKITIIFHKSFPIMQKKLANINFMANICLDLKRELAQPGRALALGIALKKCPVDSFLKL